MHEVAETTTVAFTVFVLATASLPEVGDWGELRIERAAGIPPVIEMIDGCLRLCLPLIPSIHISNQMVSNIVTDVEFEQMTRLGQLNVEILIHGIEALLKLLVGQLANGVVGGVVVHVW